MSERRFENTLVHNNMFGYRGVEWDQSRRAFRARIVPDGTHRGKFLGRFASAEDAAKAYDEAAREAYGDGAYLNFPSDGEKQTIPSWRSLGVCPKGHDLSKFGYSRPDGRGTNCKKCNSEASLRRYYRRKARPLR